MSTVDRGHARERQWMHRLEEQGDFACRPRWACVDVISMRDGAPVFFDEVKTDVSGPYANFRPARRKALRELAQKAGAVARLVWWPPHKPPQVIPEWEWPD